MKAKITARWAVLAVVVSTLSIAVAASAGFASPGNEDAPASIEQIVEAWRTRASLEAVVVATGSADGPIAVTVSGSDDGSALEPETGFRVGSIAKTFVATVIMQLVEEGRLDLEAPVADHLEGLYPDVTIRHLLTHTSGIPDYARSQEYTDGLLNEPQRRWTTAEVIGLTDGVDVDFAPGSAYSYSNTNYILLGEIIESVTGQPWWVDVHDRIVEPLGMSHTFVPGVETDREHVIRGWVDTNDDGFEDPVSGDDWPALDTLEGAAGNLVSTAEDLSVFARALFEGDLVSDAALEAMTARNPHHPPHANYGLGVEILEPDYQTTVLGHGGSEPGWRATMWYIPRDGSVIVVLVNALGTNSADLAELILRRGI